MTKPQDNESADPIEALYIESSSIGLVEFRQRIERFIAQETKRTRIDELKRAKMQGYIAGPLTHRVDRRINALRDTKHT